MKMTSENEEVQEIRKKLGHIILAKESADRFLRECNPISPTVVNQSEKSQSFTTESLITNTSKNNDQFKNKHITKDQKKFDNPKLRGKNSRFIRTNSRTPKPDHYSRKRKKEDHSDTPDKKRVKFECIFCGEQHYNDQCKNVTTIDERKKWLKNRCYLCFSDSHKAKECKSKRKCRHCSEHGKHNRALCPNLFKTNHVLSNTFYSNVTTLLQTAVVNIRKPNSSFSIKCRLLLDTGSQKTYILNKVAKELQLDVKEKIV